MSRPLITIAWEYALIAFIAASIFAIISLIVGALRGISHFLSIDPAIQIVMVMLAVFMCAVVIVVAISH